VITWATPAAIGFGTALSATQLNATATGVGGVSLPGTFTYSPATGTVPAGGTQTLTVTFTPTDTTNYTTPAAKTVSLTVNQVTLVVTAGNATKVYGTANPVFTGTVTGLQNGDVLTESFATTAAISSPAGKYAIVPSVAGANASGYTQSITNGTLTITQAGTATTLSVSSASIGAGASVTLSSQVASTTTGTPTGTVSFYDGTTLLSNVNLTSGATSYTATLLAGSTHSLSATYSGDVNFTTSSTVAAAPVVVAASGFSLNQTGGPSQTVTPGSVVVYSFAIAPSSGSVYPGNVTFSVSGLPTGATATFSPATITAGSGAQTVTMTVQTAAGTSSYKAAPTARRMAPIAMVFLLLPLFGAGRMRRRGRDMGRLLCLLLLSGLATTALLTGCGGNSTTTPTVKSYALSVTATSGAVQQTSTVTLNVQ
jgi:hypothetical protein